MTEYFWNGWLLLDGLIQGFWAWWLEFSVSPEFPVVLYATWGVFCFLMCIARITRYAIVQRQTSTLWLAGSDFFMGFALIGGSLLTAPHARYNFSYMLPYVRLFWALAFPFFAIATIEKGWFIANVIARHDPMLPNIVPVVYRSISRMQTETKPFYKSKTLWVNVIAAILMILQVTDPTLFSIDPRFIAWATLILNILLRFASGQPISLDGLPTEKTVSKIEEE